MYLFTLSTCHKYITSRLLIVFIFYIDERNSNRITNNINIPHASLKAMIIYMNILAGIYCHKTVLKILWSSIERNYTIFPKVEQDNKYNENS